MCGSMFSPACFLQRGKAVLEVICGLLFFFPVIGALVVSRGGVDLVCLVHRREGCADFLVRPHSPHPDRGVDRTDSVPASRSGDICAQPADSFRKEGKPMIEMSPEMISAVMLGGILVAVLVTGYPLALAIGGVAFWMGIYLFGPALTFEVFYSRSYDMLNNYVLLAVPGFVLMGAVLEHSGAAEGVFEEMYVWFAGLRGRSGPGYHHIGDHRSSYGGSHRRLGHLADPDRPPVHGEAGLRPSPGGRRGLCGRQLGHSHPAEHHAGDLRAHGQHFRGQNAFCSLPSGLFPVRSYCLYILVRCFLQPQIAPPVPPGENTNSFPCQDRRLVVAIGPLCFLILAVLGSIFFGIASPTEAAGVGSLATLILAAAHRRLDMALLKKAAATTVKVSGMVLLIGMLASSFTGIFMRAGCDEVVAKFIMGSAGASGAPSLSLCLSALSWAFSSIGWGFFSSWSPS